MKKISLCGKWELSGGGFSCSGNIPGSVYSFLLDNSLMPDPFYGTNELDALKIMDNAFDFSRTFKFEKIDCRVLLCADGLDTLATINLNGHIIAKTNNMHRFYEFDITDILKNGENEIKIHFDSPSQFVKEMQAKEPVRSIHECMAGFPHLRKASCMMGWDWGPRLPDAGIWKDIYLILDNSDRIEEVYITQRHENGRVFVTPSVTTTRGTAEIKITATAPDGRVFALEANRENEIESPTLWWPNGFGEQALYSIKTEIIENDVTVDCDQKRIGLRTLTLPREKDEWGETYCHEINGVRIFAMGGDYIPEDNILSRLSKERTEKLLRECVECNFNTIRVWGGGFYPHDYFFDLCDELGLLVFEDLMFACMALPAHKEMLDNISVEIEQNMKRIRHHACLAVISGNNEIEIAMDWWKGEGETARRADYIKTYERLIPSIHARVCPEIPFVSSSPTGYGGFVDSRNLAVGDSHFWAVWHQNLPFSAFRRHNFRYLSEFGFASYPNEKTINEYIPENERNIMSRTMEQHIRSNGSNGKLLSYLSEYYLYPQKLGDFIYATHLLQADAIRTAVHHLRRNRNGGQCSGALYWQINDIYPAVSWAAIDSRGRWKALQYDAKRFFAPIMISCDEKGETTTRPYVYMQPEHFDYSTEARLAVTNETLNEVEGTVRWELRSADAKVLLFGKEAITVPALSTVSLENIYFNQTDVEHNYLSFAFLKDGEVVSDGTVLFTAPKHFRFENPNLRFERNGDEITVFADAYAKYVEIYSLDSDFRLDDNYFDMNGGSKTVKIIDGQAKTILLRSVYDIK
ncbi:MAG: glycoside hydrolase family 2 protein [Clostridia bacterium]|nr:glycoside hydrolase family 2 protein [Clostridia bacterium]